MPASLRPRPPDGRAHHTDEHGHGFSTGGCDTLDLAEPRAMGGPAHEVRYGSWRIGRSTPTTSWKSEEHTSELQSHHDLVCRLLLEKKKKLNSTQPIKKTTKEKHTTKHMQIKN